MAPKFETRGWAFEDSNTSSNDVLVDVEETEEALEALPQNVPIPDAPGSTWQNRDPDHLSYDPYVEPYVCPSSIWPYCPYY